MDGWTDGRLGWRQKGIGLLSPDGDSLRWVKPRLPVQLELTTCHFILNPSRVIEGGGVLLLFFLRDYYAILLSIWHNSALINFRYEGNEDKVSILAHYFKSVCNSRAICIQDRDARPWRQHTKRIKRNLTTWNDCETLSSRENCMVSHPRNCCVNVLHWIQKPPYSDYAVPIARQEGCYSVVAL